MKKLYNAPELESILLSVADVIATSSIHGGEDGDLAGLFGEVNPLRR